jgi:hypothetical protein
MRGCTVSKNILDGFVKSLRIRCFHNMWLEILRGALTTGSAVRALYESINAQKKT